MPHRCWNRNRYIFQSTPQVRKIIFQNSFCSPAKCEIVLAYGKKVIFCLVLSVYLRVSVCLGYTFSTAWAGTIFRECRCNVFRRSRTSLSTNIIRSRFHGISFTWLKSKYMQSNWINIAKNNKVLFPRIPRGYHLLILSI